MIATMEKSRVHGRETIQLTTETADKGEVSGVRLVSAPPPAPVEFRYTQDEDFVTVLQQLGASLVITTYQANKLLVARVAGAGLSTLVRTFDRPMGLAVGTDRLAL